MGKLWTVKEVCALTGLTGKHLYYFHHAGIAKAAAYSNYSVQDHDGYKLYDDAGVAKLQQIAMYYELGLKRNEICDLMNAPGYDMHRALDELQAQLEEKQNRIRRHIRAIEQIRKIGTKQQLLDIFSGISLEELGRNGITVETSAIKDYWTAKFATVDLDGFQATLEELLQKPGTAADPAQQRQRIHKLFRHAMDCMGFAGFLFVSGLFLSAVGGGTIAEELPTNITPAHGQLAFAYIKDILDALLEDIAGIIAEHHSAIGCPYDAPPVVAMVKAVKKALQTHIGLQGKEEYRLLLDMCKMEPPSGPEDYLAFLFHALRYHTETFSE